MTVCTLSVKIQSICITCSVIVVHEVVSVKLHIWAKDVIKGVRGASSSWTALKRVFEAVGKRLPGIT